MIKEKKNNFEWDEYYTRWSERISKYDVNHLFKRVIEKYGNTMGVDHFTIFDVLFEYAKRKGVQINSDNDDFDFLVEEYDIDNYMAALFYTENPVIIIREKPVIITK